MGRWLHDLTVSCFFFFRAGFLVLVSCELKLKLTLNIWTTVEEDAVERDRSRKLCANSLL